VVTQFSNKTGRAYLLDTAEVISDRTRSSCDHVTLNKPQYTSFRFTQHLVDAGIDASIGTVGDALDNALAESTIGLYKTELIKPQGPWQYF